MNPRIFSMTDADAVSSASETIKKSGVILYPTDTLYGLGVDALSDEAVDLIYKIKGRDEGKPMSVIVNDMEMMERYGHVDDIAHRLAKRFFPGALTLVLKKKEGFDTGVCRSVGTIGMRIPKNDFCLELVRAYDAPITATSANRAGMKPENSVAAILDQLGSGARMIGCVIDAGELPDDQPSTVVDLSGDRPVILRDGVIPATDIWEELIQYID